MLYSQGKEGVAVPECEKEVLRDGPGEANTLSFHLPWIKDKWWYTYRMKYFSISVFQKLSAHEIKDYHKKAQQKAKHFVMSFEAVTHDKHETDKYQKNLHILKLITKAALLCSGQGIAFQFHRKQSNYKEGYHEI